MEHQIPTSNNGPHLLSAVLYIFTLISGFISLLEIEQILRIVALVITCAGGLVSIGINWPVIKEKYFKTKQ